MSKKKTKEAQYYMSAINNPVLNYKVNVMKPVVKLLVSIALITAGGILGLIFYGGLFKADGEATSLTRISNIVVFLVVGLIARKIFFPKVNEMMRVKRLNQLTVQFCDFLESLSNSLSGGSNMVDSINSSYGDLVTQYGEDSLIANEVREIIYGIQNNIPIEDMFMSLGQRSGDKDIVNFSIVFSTAYRTGGNIKTIIRRTSEIISEKRVIASEIQTKLTSNKMQMQVMNVIPIFIVLLIKLMSSELAASFSSGVGVIGMTVGVALFVGAYKLGDKIMDIKG